MDLTASPCYSTNTSNHDDTTDIISTYREGQRDIERETERQRQGETKTGRDRERVRETLTFYCLQLTSPEDET